MSRRKSALPPPADPMNPFAPPPPPVEEPAPFIGPTETTDICQSCRRTVRRSLTRENRTPGGVAGRVCSRYMRSSCDKLRAVRRV